MGMAKAWLRVRGQPILEYLWQQLKWEGPAMVVCAPGVEKPPGAATWGREVVDRLAGQGPLRGILTALEHARSEIVLVTTVDMVGVTHEMLAHLVAALHGAAGAKGAMYAVGGRIEPFPCVLRREMLDVIVGRIARGQLSVQQLGNEAVQLVSAPREWNDRVWVNLNRPEDLAMFEELP